MPLKIPQYSLLCRTFFTLVAPLVGAAAYSAGPDKPFTNARKVVFLGDSITHSGQYIAMAETALRLQDPTFDVEFLSVGLSSETVSGLSEEGHAGGKFPRPDLHERLDRVLSATKPDLVVACYGMNCGIYHPLGEERFAAYRRGMEKLRERAAAYGAGVMHLTPPVFDPEPIKERTLPAGADAYPKPYVGYDEVLAKYSQWLMLERKAGWNVCDLHAPMKARLEEGRAADPKFVLSPDGVHPNLDGHWIMAVAWLRDLGFRDVDLKLTSESTSRWKPTPKAAAIYALVHKRQQLRHDAWLTETGHKRPGVKAGLPTPEADAKGREINAEIKKLLSM